MNRDPNEVAAGGLLAGIGAEASRDPQLAIATAQAYAILALARQLGRVAAVMESRERRL